MATEKKCLLVSSQQVVSLENICHLIEAESAQWDDINSAVMVATT